MHFMRVLAALSLVLLLPLAAAAKPMASAEALLAALANAKNPGSAKQIEEQLQAVWSHSGSPSGDLLLRRSQQALSENDVKSARSVLKALTATSPNFAQGWYTRAQAALSADDYTDALLSLRRTLQLQPRHYDALADLGALLEEFNDKPHALATYRRALAINPFITGMRVRVRQLERDVEGQRI